MRYHYYFATSYARRHMPMRHTPLRHRHAVCYDADATFRLLSRQARGSRQPPADATCRLMPILPPHTRTTLSHADTPDTRLNTVIITQYY